MMLTQETTTHIPLLEALKRHRQVQCAPDIEAVCAALAKQLQRDLTKVSPFITIASVENRHTSALECAGEPNEAFDVAELRLTHDHSIHFVLTRKTFLCLISVAMGDDGAGSVGRLDRTPSSLEYLIVAHIIMCLASSFLAVLDSAEASASIAGLKWYSEVGRKKDQANCKFILLNINSKRWKGWIELEAPIQIFPVMGKSKHSESSPSIGEMPISIPSFAADAILKLEAHLSTEPCCFSNILALRVGDTVALSDVTARSVILSCANQNLFSGTLSRDGLTLVAHIDAPIPNRTPQLSQRGPGA
jgi:hypothetical protein